MEYHTQWHNFSKEFRAGDILLIRSNSFWNKIVRLVTDSHYGHAALVLEDGNDALLEVECPRSYISRDGFNKYIYNGSLETALLLRPIFVLPDDFKRRLKIFALGVHNTKYDIVHVLSILVAVTIGRWVLFSKFVLPQSDNKFICSEAIGLFYKSIDVDITDDLIGVHNMIPDMFTMTEKFKPVSIFRM